MHDPAGKRLPIKLDTATNGEYEPIPLEPVHHEANHLALEAATRSAKRLALSRRSFLVSACGAASTLLAMNEAYAKRGLTGGFYEIPEGSGARPSRSPLRRRREGIHLRRAGAFRESDGAWLKRVPEGEKPLRFSKTTSCAPTAGPGPYDYLKCIGPDEFVKDVFMDSDTDLMVLSFVPSRREDEPLTIEEAFATAKIVEKLDGTHRLYIHGRVNPNQPGDLEAMDEMAARHRIAAWKCYTQFGPGGKGFFLDDDVAAAMVEKARKLGVRNIAVHKGFPFGSESYEQSTCVDVGRAAKRFPDINYLIYHSGFVAEKREGPYDPKRTDGVDAFVTSLAENGIKPGANVYAELGSTWRFNMRNPDSAAHLLGQAPQGVRREQRALGHGLDLVRLAAGPDPGVPHVPDLEGAARQAWLPGNHAALRAKIFGLNALKIYPVPKDVLDKHMKDRVAASREEYRNAPDPSFATYGPKTRREFLALLSA
jgi:hypothetical protein